MIIGIVAVVFGFVPFCGVWAVAPAVVGLGLGIADLIVKAKRGQPKGMAIAGVVLNPLAIIIVVLWYVLFIAAANEAMEQATMQGMVFQQPGTVPTVPLQTPPAPPPLPG
ncbi:MAG: hypothetical protein JRI55_27240, partial [Deltaproteobacteria bacterium]|nr:hypothetical protein [Deltaproteobacteria bacterium]